jgi:hypothetical protein
MKSIRQTHVKEEKKRRIVCNNGQLLSDEKTFNEVMATIGHWQSLVN